MPSSGNRGQNCCAVLDGVCRVVTDQLQSGGPGLETVFVFLCADSSRTLYDIVLAIFQLGLLVALVVILDVVQRRLVIAGIVVLVKIKEFVSRKSHKVLAERPVDCLFTKETKFNHEEGFDDGTHNVWPY